MVDVCDIQVMRPILERYGFHFSKAKGQNFLTASWVPERIAREAGVDKDCGVLEIGPGMGPLTQQLCLRAGKVCAVELDRRLEPVLRETVGEMPNLELVWADILKQDIPALTAEKLAGLRPMACANLPYYITSPILSALLEARCFRSVTVMVQREVALRIAARPGTPDYGAFSLMCQYYAKPKILFEVPPDCFVPRPKVTSAVVSLETYDRSPWGAADEAMLFRTVRASFAMRRKTLQNGLAAGFPELGKAGAGTVLLQCGIDPGVRGETLSLRQFVAISNAIAERKQARD